jgi:hypothetical protein
LGCFVASGGLVFVGFVLGCFVLRQLGGLFFFGLLFGLTFLFQLVFLGLGLFLFFGGLCQLLLFLRLQLGFIGCFALCGQFAVL